MSITDLTARRLSQQIHDKDQELIRLRAEHMEMESTLRNIDHCGPMTEADAVRDGDLGSYRQAMRARLVLSRIRDARAAATSDLTGAA